MKRLFLLLSIFISTSAYAENSSLNLALPSAPGTYGQDSIRAGELDCKNAIGGATQFEFGVTGIVDNYNSPFSSGTGDESKDIGLRKKRIEVLKLQEELEALKRMNRSSNFEN